jgi:hypothetical protein
MKILAATQDPEVSARMGVIVLPLPSPDLPEAVKVMRGSACCGPNPVVRMRRACSPCRAATRLRAGLCRVLGIQGALASLILAPVYIYAIVLGEVDDSMQEQVLMDCDRAFYRMPGLVIWKVIGQSKHYSTFG